MENELTLKKGDKILIVILMIVSLGLIVPILNSAPESHTAVVKVKNEEVLRLDLLQDGNYSVKGTLGDVNIEVKDQAVRVSQENSPHHYCSKQGYVKDANVPIVCLPNETVITIEGNNDKEDVLIQ